MRTPASESTTAQKKRAVNLTLNEALVTQAKTFTGNLSSTVETLLVDYVAQQQLARVSDRKSVV